MRNFKPLLLMVLLLLLVGTSVAQGGITINGFSVSFEGRTYNSGADTTTFAYRVSGTETPPDLSHFDIEIPDCDGDDLDVVSYSPTDAVEFGTDPTTGVNGIKWDLPLSVSASRVYAITFAGDVSLGQVTVAVKGGNGFEAGTLPGAGCTEAAVAVTKYVSVDGGTTWLDADLPLGPLTDPGEDVFFRIEVENTGDFPLESVTLTDNTYDVSGCGIPATLEVDQTATCDLGPFPAVEGQQQNIAIVNAIYEGNVYTASDGAYYYAGDLPSVQVKKYVRKGSTWYDADDAPGIQVLDGGEVSFRFVVTNNGTAPLTNITLTDDQFTIPDCDIPATLEPEVDFTCEIGPFDVTEETHVNTATVTALAGDEEVSDSDSAHYFVDDEADDDDLDIIIIIEGEVEAIIDNIIIIFGQEIVLDADDPLLLVIQVGDFIRIEGDWEGDVIIAIIVIVIDIDIYVNDDGGAWRDDGKCSNPPPPWAPAHGWRRKCESGGGSRSGSRS